MNVNVMIRGVPYLVDVVHDDKRRPMLEDSVFCLAVPATTETIGHVTRVPFPGSVTFGEDRSDWLAENLTEDEWDEIFDTISAELAYGWF